MNRSKFLSFDLVKALLASALLLASPGLLAQYTYNVNQPVFPAFEGWRQNADGTFSFLFGYMNENWEEEPDIPIGDNNYFSPGDRDRGQPTHFFPRRNRFVFEVQVPADWGDRELVWTINHKGQEYSAYGTLNPGFVVDNLLIASETGSLGAGTSSPESRANVPPVLTVIGDDVRTAQVGESITIQSRVTDDGIPRVRPASTVTEEQLNRRMFNSRGRPTVEKVNGLWVAWSIYRGPGDGVTFDPPQNKVWEDTRWGANSPWGIFWTPPVLPEDGTVEVTASFDKPGTYVLWGRADDGGLYHDQYITVNVTE